MGRAREEVNELRIRRRAAGLDAFPLHLAGDREEVRAKREHLTALFRIALKMR